MLQKVKNIRKLLRELALWKKALICIVVSAGIYFFWPKTDTTVISYKMETVKLSDVTQVVSETGSVMSSGKTDVNSSITGIIQKVLVENGTTVTKGQALFSVTSSATEAERAQAYASYLSAKNSLDTAQRNKQTIESEMWKAHEAFESQSLDTELSVNDPIYIQTQREWSAAEKKYLDQDKVIQQAQASLNQAWLAYQATIDGTVKAPIGGVIANVSVAPGQQVTATDTALVVSSDAETWIKVSVGESDVSEIKPDQEAQVSLDALSEAKFMARVKRVDDFGTDSSGVITYTVYLVLDNPSEKVRPEMTAQVDITTQSKKNVLTVSNAALKSYQGKKAVQVLDESKQLKYIFVEIGLKGDSVTEILSGVSEGQEIVTSNSGTSAGTSSSTGTSSSSQTQKSGGGFLAGPGGR